MQRCAAQASGCFSSNSSGHTPAYPHVFLGVKTYVHSVPHTDISQTPFTECAARSRIASARTHNIHGSEFAPATRSVTQKEGQHTC